MSPTPADAVMAPSVAHAHATPSHPLAELSRNCVADALRLDSFAMAPAQQRAQLQRNNSFLDVEELRAVCCRSGRSAFLDPLDEDQLVVAGTGGISGALLLGQSAASGMGSACTGLLGKLPQMLAAAALPPPLVTTGAFGEMHLEEPESSESDTSCCFEKAWYCLQQVEQEEDEGHSPSTCHGLPVAAQQQMQVVGAMAGASALVAKSAVASRAALGVPQRRKASPATSVVLVPGNEDSVGAAAVVEADHGHVVVPTPAPIVKAFHHKSGGPCDHCGAKESPQWRRGPPAKPTLCNACGTRYRRTNQLGVPGVKAATANKGAAAAAKRSLKRPAAGHAGERAAKAHGKATAAAVFTPGASASMVDSDAQPLTVEQLC